MSALFRLIRKYPKPSAIIFAVLVLISFISQPRSQIQPQETLEEADEPFDSSQCKVYVVGILAGAIVHQFKTTNNTLAYVMVADREEVVRIFEKNNIYLWKTRQDFQSTEYAELVQVLPPESVQELNRLLSINPYVAMGTEEIAKTAKPTMFDSDKCEVE